MGKTPVIHGSRSEFNNIANSYDDLLKELFGIWGKNNERFAEYKIQLLKHVLKSSNLKSILDFGCGTGRSLIYLDKYFSESNNLLKISGCDTSDESIEVAKKLLPKADFFINTDVSSFKRIECKYDLIFLACVLHHIDPKERLPWVEAIIDKLQPGGYVAVFEHNLLNPYTRKIIRNPINEYDQEDWMLSHKELVSLLSDNRPDVTMYFDGYTLFSPIRFSWSSTFEIVFKRIPLGAQHVVVIQKTI